ncbi:uncharacterized protein BXZ73DRAFT_81784 [Epithele typhae]|uniref:uncharacterized protein n=1 Tax=Epithele typhae TaxID=378194 RepID=UPI002008BF34|nr:uncharacterized protein BXZ73DRAFT_81784 [Epithele typhae]KAH9913982.1 hypothetical protein BXZ73DRAFT_81784 [Epithele typhae]
MYLALLIDEILQLVFDFCGDIPSPEPGWTYSQLARTCKAWKEPALDRLWARLGSIEPLLALQKDDTMNSLVLHAYTSRVKSITLRHAIPKTIKTPYPLFELPRLESVTLLSDGCMAPQAWAVSSRLKHVHINTGYSRSQQELLDRSNAAAKLLLCAGNEAPCLESLYIRGRMTDTLNSVVTGLTQLRSLNIKGNCFIEPDTLAAIATFPALESLSVYANRVNASAFEDAVPAGVECFPSLKRLAIRASGPSSPLFSLASPMAGLPEAATSLRELVIDDLTDISELDATHASPRWYTVDLLAPLARLKALERISFLSRTSATPTSAYSASGGPRSHTSTSERYLTMRMTKCQSGNAAHSRCVRRRSQVLPLLAEPRSSRAPALHVDHPGVLTHTRREDHKQGPPPATIQQRVLHALTIGDVPELRRTRRG